jgi:hypothetical protein
MVTCLHAPLCFLRCVPPLRTLASTRKGSFS